MSQTKVAVVGVGQFGRNHARTLASMPGVELVGVVDANEESAVAVARQLGTTPYSNPAEIVGKVDAVCVVVPTAHHARVASPFLSRGVATLVEKPLAFSPEEARDMVRLAQRHRAVLQVGHIERFNPAWTAVEGQIESPDVIDACRYSEYPFRSLDISVVFDLMVHDLDLALLAANAPVARVEATGAKVLSNSWDRVDACLDFANGCRAMLSASRVHHQPVRTMRLSNAIGTWELDYFRRTVSCCRLRSTDDSAAIRRLPVCNSPEDRHRLVRELFDIQSAVLNRSIEPLRLELENFIHCARTGDAPKVTGAHAHAVVCLARRIEEAVAYTRVAQPLRRSA